MIESVHFKLFNKIFVVSVEQTFASTRDAPSY